MRVKRMYEVVLRVYPVDYRARFAAEMLTVFEEEIDVRCGDRPLPYVRFVLAEMAGLLWNIAREWIAKATADRSSRGRYLPDCRRMRPPGVTLRQWAAGLASVPLSRGGEDAD